MLQAVSASVSLPYWDFTIDGEDVIRHRGGDFSRWFESEVRPAPLAVFADAYSEVGALMVSPGLH
jgi:hypothetical protein